ncbi:MAG: beta-ketoacyl-[acyl-carrier-protein] synthase family protein [Candidatus Omnitrophica bacterium]|nr:beta-ketoacyl-[acyl-carrier-protein] synthase family protein [Candidatus Omnitrophota bacterium]MCM8831208.1 beta-ketoacyl-[acyl-carrier-protein] synthase family protein [Candidatus Omnitrophota bacterium]
MNIVISGIGVISSIGIGKENFFGAIKEGRCGINDITFFDTSNLKTKKAAIVNNFRPEEILGQKGLRTLDRATKLLLSAGKLALVDAKLEEANIEPTEIGISIGTTVGSIWSITEFDKVSLKDGPHFVNPAEFPNTVINSPPSQLAIRFGIKGPCSTISSGFTASTDAIKYAMDLIKNGHAKIVLAGGVEEFCQQIYLAFYKAKFLAGIKGEEICCPFDARRNGIIFGEGSAVLVLEKEETAIKRNARIYGYLRGYGTFFSPYSVSKYHPSGYGLKEAIKEAIKNAGLEIYDIDYICAASNSTKEADLIETKIIKEIFGDKARKIPISSIKSMIGETFSAAGAFSNVAALCTINNNFIPPTIGYKIKDPDCDLDYVPNRARECNIKNVLVNTFSPAGNNSCIVISKNSF